MGIFDFFKNHEREVEEDITPPVSDVLLQALLDNRAITREEAMNIPAVSGNVDFISNIIATMPIKLYKKENEDIKEIKDKRVQLLNSDTKDTLNAFQLKSALVEDYLMGKGGFCYIEKYRNEVIALKYVQNEYITILKNYKPIHKKYQIMVEGNRYNDFDFIKLLRNTRDGSTGESITNEVNKALETAYNSLL